MNNQDRIYIDWNENYGKTFKLVHTPEGRQSGEWSPNLVSVVTPENGDAWTDWIELENTDSWKENWDNIQKSLGDHKYNQIIRSMRTLDNLQEQISRIKKLIQEININNEFKISYKYNPEVEDLQKLLFDKGYYIGNFGPKKNGIDGKYGPLTKAAHDALKNDIVPKEFNNNVKTLPKKFDDRNFDVNNNTSTKLKNIIIGDSQTPYVDMNTTKASRISSQPGKSSLWEGGKSVSWLISALEDFPITPDVNNVIIVIGTNGGFGKYMRDNIPKLFNLLRNKFPSSKFYVVQGSWGWGALKNININDVRSYYQKFEIEGAKIIEPPIGPIEPHGNKPIYKIIGKNIDSYL